MKRLVTVFFLFSAIILSAQFPVLEIGENMPKSDEMKCAVTNKVHTLDKLAEENGLLLIFSCNTCPFVIAWEDRYPVVADIARENKIGFALLNSNYTKRDGDDSFEAMQKHAKKNDYSFPYLVDSESALANALGAQTTPHVFLFDKNMKLVYKGAIDDNYKDAADVEEFYLKDALNKLGAGEEIKNSETRNLGCSIKRKTS